MEDAAAVKVLTTITLIYLPATVVSVSRARPAWFLKADRS